MKNIIGETEEAVNDNRLDCIVQGCSIIAVVIVSVAMSTTHVLLNGSASDYSRLTGRVKGHDMGYLPWREVPFCGM